MEKVSARLSVSVSASLNKERIVMDTPRVRTLEESRNLPEDAVSWIEVKKGTDTEYAYNAMPPGIRESVLWPEEYGIKWRVWEGKPTKSQRNATPWQ